MAVAGRQDLNPLTAAFLACLAKKRPFDAPVELQEWGLHDIPMPPDDSSRGRRLPLPVHRLLEVHILTVPLSYLTQKNPPIVKIVWVSILVDTALARDQKGG